jgi:hypothetical protein
MTTPDRVAVLRRVITEAKPRKLKQDFTLKEPLAHGWLRPYLLQADAFTWGRWAHWLDTHEAGRLLGAQIPRIEWSEGQGPGRKMLEHCLDSVTRYGGWRGWSGENHFNFFLDWLLYGFGDGAQKELPEEGRDTQGAHARLWQLFNLETMLAYPYDYFGDILAESGYGRHCGFFPTPLHVCEMMVRMQMHDEGEDCRAKTVCDPAAGTGRMLLCASNHSFRLYGMDINRTVLRALRVNGWLYAPWLVAPFPFLDTYEGAHEDAPAIPHLTQKLPDLDHAGNYTLQLA